MNKLSTARRAAVVAALVEGNSIRSTSRMLDVSKPTILKLLADIGAACANYHDRIVRNLRCAHIQADEIWSFVGAKAKNVPAEKADEWGDLWTWTAIDADTKLMVSYVVGGRTQRSAYALMDDLAARIAGRVQITTDGFFMYRFAVEKAFGIDADHAMQQKHYGRHQEGRYSPGTFIGATKEVLKGNPDPDHISTSFVERQNLTMRMSMRRFTRLTNGFSKKAANHVASVDLHFIHYNFARVHKTLRITPAMAAGISDHVWSINEIVGLLDAVEKKAA